MCLRNLLATNEWLHLIYGYDKTNSKLIVRNVNGVVCEKTGVTLKVRTIQAQGTSMGIQLLRLSKQASDVFYVRKFLIWFLPPNSLDSTILTATVPDPISRTLKESSDLFFIAERLGRFRKVYNQRKDGKYGKLFLILPDSLERLAGVEVMNTPSIPTRPTEGDSLSTPNLQNRQTFEYFRTDRGEIRSNWFVPTRTQQTEATIEGWIYPVSLIDASLKYYFPLFGLRYVLFLMIRDTNRYLGCWAYSSQSTGYEKGGGYDDANMVININQWTYVACLHSGINLWTLKNEHVKHVSSNLGFTLNYHAKNIQLQIGPTNANTWSWAPCSFALRQFRYWQLAMHSDYLIDNRFKKLDGSRWAYLGLYYQMGQRENGLIVDSSVNQMHLKSGWSIYTDVFTVNTVYNIGRLTLCPHGQTRDYQNNNQCFTGLALPRFTPSKPVMFNKCGFSSDLTYTKEMWIAPKAFTLPHNTIWAFPFWTLAYIQTSQASQASPVVASRIRLQIIADRIFTDYDVTNKVAVDTWSHIAFAYRKLSRTQLEVKFQLNGEELDNQIYTRVSQRDPRSEHYDCWSLGYQTDRAGNNPSHHFDGFMARVRVWKEFRTSGNIKKYMHDSFLLNKFDANLKIYWKMDDTANGWRIYDYSPSKLHVTIPATNYYEFELVPEGLVLCEGHSWWDGTECRQDIWAISRFRTTGSRLSLANLNFGTTNGYSLSFWYYQVNSGTTSSIILDDTTCTGGTGLYFVQSSTTFYGDVCGTGYSTSQTRELGKWIHILSSHSTSNPDQSWIWRNTVLKIHINNAQGCCYSGQYMLLDTRIWGVYLRDFALFNERMVQGDAYRLYYGELPHNIRGMLYLYRLSEGDGQGIMNDQLGIYSRKYDKASRDEFIHWLYDEGNQRRCNHQGYRYNSDSGTCEPLQVHYIAAGSEWEKVLAHMGCMWSAISNSIVYEYMTYEFWINIESLGTLDYIMGFQDYNNKRISFYWGTSGYRVQIKLNTDTIEGVATTCADICGQWIHVVLQVVNTGMKLHINGLKVEDKSNTNMGFSNSNKYIVMGNPSNTGSFYIRNLIWWSFNGFLSDAFIRERAIYPLSQTSFSKKESLHQFPRPPYQTNIAAMFWLDDDMVQSTQTYKMLAQSRACHIFIHHHAFKPPPIYEHPDQQTIQEYPPMAAGSSFDLSIPTDSTDGQCNFVFDTWI